MAWWTRSSTIEDVPRKFQAALSIIEQWALRWKLSIKATKSESAVLALGNNTGSLASSQLPGNGQQLRCTKTPKFLEVNQPRPPHDLRR